MCDCIKEMEENLKKYCQKDYKKTIESVSCADAIISLSDGKTKQITNFNISFVDMKKKKTLRMAHNYCPFCGEKQ